MSTPLPHRRASVAGALLAILAAVGCGGGGVSVDSDEAPAAADAVEPDRLVAAALAPAREALRLALDTGRFAILDAPALIEAGADLSDTLIALPGRDGQFALRWFDADHNGALSSGDGLRLDAAPRNGGRRNGLHVPDLTCGAGTFATPALYADLAPAASDSTGTALSGTLAMSYARGAIGERLTVGCGAAGFHCTAPAGDAVLDSLDLTFELQPYSHAWTLQVRATLAHARFGALTLQTTTPLRGVLRPDGTPGPVESGRFVVRRAGGGSVSVLFSGPDSARVRADDDGDGIIDQNLPTSWSALTATPTD